MAKPSVKKVKKVAKKVAAEVSKKVGRVAKAAAKTIAKEVAKKAGPRQRRAAQQALVKELGVIAKKVSVLGKEALAQGIERAGKAAKTGLATAEMRSGKLSGKLGSEIASIKKAALARVKR